MQLQMIFSAASLLAFAQSAVPVAGEVPLLIDGIGLPELLQKNLAKLEPIRSVVTSTTSL